MRLTWCLGKWVYVYVDGRNGEMAVEQTGHAKDKVGRAPGFGT